MDATPTDALVSDSQNAGGELRWICTDGLTPSLADSTN